MTKSYHINELAISLIFVSYSLNCCYNFWCVSGSLLFFHQAPQVEKESGPEREEDIGDSQEPLWTIPLMIIVNFILLAIVFQTYVQIHFYHHVHEYYFLVL